ncbi:hypothetical protein C8J57DRAFT_1275494 [Mycena rebaudengoi]|nr:hypothetical protein C8J57DRAFT_1275494 [Mycena rebaudengoi]
MQLIALLLAAASVALATPTVSSFSAAGCSGEPLAIWSGVREDAFCKATPGAISLSIIPGTDRCQIDLLRTPNCSGVHGGWISTVPVENSCFNASEVFSSVRILCITTG